MLRNAHDVIIIGAGPAGLFAARRLAKMGKRVTVVEKEADVGGKCNTYSDKDQPDVKTERGAGAIAPNYGVVLDAIEEKGVQLEELLPPEQDESIADDFNNLHWWEKIGFSASFVAQLIRFTHETANYQYLRDHAEELPPDYELPFAAFAEKYNLPEINTFLKMFVTAFGYGLMEECPAYCVMEYMGLTTIPGLLASPLRSGIVEIKDGFQGLMQKVAEDFPVVTSAQVTSIVREKDKVTVTYQNDLKQNITLTANALVLAISPMHWPELGMKLTPVEEDCVRGLSVYRYPVAVCKVKGAKANIHYTMHGSERSGLGTLALFTTRDNRKDTPRLGTAYINLPRGDQDFQFTEQQLQGLQEQLKTELHAEQAEIIEHKIWEDYMPTLPWQQRLALEKAQFVPGVQTIYAGAYTLGGFEDVACVTEQATKAVDKYLLMVNSSRLEYYKKEAGRAQFFYRQPRLPAVSDSVPVINNYKI